MRQLFERAVHGDASALHEAAEAAREVFELADERFAVDRSANPSFASLHGL